MTEKVMRADRTIEIKLFEGARDDPNFICIHLKKARWGQNPQELYLPLLARLYLAWYPLLLGLRGEAR
jgi:hypothetical protein